MQQSSQDILCVETNAIYANGIEGDMAEVGVYEGTSGVLIAKNTSKPVYLFDTFEGMPEDEDGFSKGSYSFPFDEAKNVFSPYPNARLIKGRVEDTAVQVADKKFSLVNIDCDLSKSILFCLEFFWPRITSGGCIMVHDMSNERVWKCVTSFFDNRQDISSRSSGGDYFVGYKRG